MPHPPSLILVIQLTLHAPGLSEQLSFYLAMDQILSKRPFIPWAFSSCRWSNLLAERIFRGFLFSGRRILLRILSPDFFSSFLWGKKKCPKKSSRKIPGKILQILHNKNPRHIPAEGPGQQILSQLRRTQEGCGGFQREQILPRKFLNPGRNLRAPGESRRKVLRQDKKSTKINFLGPETAWCGGSLPREGVVVENMILNA